MGLRELRQTKGLTLKGLAALSGVNYMKIHQIETGKINPGEHCAQDRRETGEGVLTASPKTFSPSRGTAHG